MTKLSRNLVRLALLGCCAALSGCQPASAKLAASPKATAQSAPAAAPAASQASAASLSRFELLWRVDGVGRFYGVVGEGVYFAVENSGDGLQALKLADGKSLWRTPLPERVVEWVSAGQLPTSVVFAYATDLQKPTAARVLAVAPKNGRMLWSKLVSCKSPSVRAEASRVYLFCADRVPSRPNRFIELDVATGDELGQVNLPADAMLSSGGEICSTNADILTCGRRQGAAIAALWSLKAQSVRRLEVTSKLAVLETDPEKISAFQLIDGKPAWTFRGQQLTLARDGLERLVVIQGEDMVVLRSSDGAELARFPSPARYGYSLHSGAGRMVIQPHGGGDEALYLIDAEARVRPLAPNVMFLDEVAGDVLLSHDVGMSGSNREAASLDAYSLTHFSVPEQQLGQDERVIAVLERHRFSYEAPQALEELRPIPGWLESLERVVKHPPPRVESIAFAVAGQSGDLRFLAPLAAALDQIKKGPAGPAEWGSLLDLVSALAELPSEEVPRTLLAFWHRLGSLVAPASRRKVIYDLVADSLYRYGALRDWVECRAGTFERGVQSASATLGTQSPGLGYVVDTQRRWAAICEARRDDDGNGRLEVVTLHHGEHAGDQLEPFLVLGSGAGTPIDDFVAAGPSGKWLVVTKDMCVQLIDAASGKGTVLRGADGRAGDAAIGPHRAASFSPDGRSLLYIKSSGPHALVVVRDLSTGNERSIEPGPGLLGGAFFDASGQFIVMNVVERDTDGDGVARPPVSATTLGSRRCRGTALSWSEYGSVGDRPVQRIVKVRGGAVEAAPAGAVFQRAMPILPAYELVARSSNAPDPSQRNAPLPIGPLRWQPRAR